MQIIYTPSGDIVAAMKAQEAVVIETALMCFAPENPYCELAARMLRDIVAANEQFKRRAEEDAEAAASAST
ncbi:hypothetical protein [Streptomyces sp. NPDC058989]|uniref:hypothetical protein n=1 Tax=Streptomyces sp. NPDC058989 TaxID=3346686 RepID=UPI00368A7A7A